METFLIILLICSVVAVLFTIVVLGDTFSRWVDVTVLVSLFIMGASLIGLFVLPKSPAEKIKQDVDKVEQYLNNLEKELIELPNDYRNEDERLTCQEVREYNHKLELIETILDSVKRKFHKKISGWTSGMKRLGKIVECY